MTDKEIEKLVSDIIKINKNLEESLIERVLLRLFSFGYEIIDDDYWCLTFSIDKATNKIKNLCNISNIPKELSELLIDRICGEFLFNKKQSNQLELDSFNFDVAVKQLQMGDTNIQFATNEGSETDEQKITSLINYLMNYGEEQLICCRKLKW